MNVYLNARFTRQPFSGVQRYAAEISKRLEDKLKFVSPQGIASGVKGHAWEQFRLPRYLGENLLWSPGNTGPIAVRNQVVTIHDLSFIDYPEGFSKSFQIWYRWLIPRLTKNVRHIVTVSAFSKNRIEAEYGVSEEKISVIRCGVSSSFKPPSTNQVEALKKKLKLPNSYLLCLGSQNPRKNIKSVLKVWREFHTKNPRSNLVVLGGDHSIFTTNVAPESIPSVKYLESVTESQLPTLIGGAESLVYPSFYEGFGLPVLEAMACGTPVIASKIPSVVEIAEDNVLYVDPHSENAIFTEMDRLHNDSSLRSRLRGQGIQQARNFSWDATASQIWKVLETLVLDRRATHHS